MKLSVFDIVHMCMLEKADTEVNINTEEADTHFSHGLCHEGTSPSGSGCGACDSWGSLFRAMGLTDLMQTHKASCVSLIHSHPKLIRP